MNRRFRLSSAKKPRRPSNDSRRVRFHSRPSLESLERRELLTTFNVNSLADLASPAAGTVTLRSAIEAANMAGGDNTINLTVPGTYQLSLIGTANETDNAAGELALLGTGNLNVVNTSGGKAVVDGGGLNRVFDINPAAENTTPFTVTFQGLTITDGRASPDDAGAGSGGGIRAQGAASVVLNNDVIDNNSATADGGGIALESANNDSVGTLTVNNSTISNNHAGDAGGGIETDGTGLIAINAGTIIVGNTCVNQGAGIWLDAGGAGLDVTGATITNNRALTMLAGGIGNAGAGNVSISDSFIAHNFSGGTGGGFGDAANMGNLTVTNTLFADNISVGNGGAIQEGGPNTTVSYSTFQSNLAGGTDDAVGDGGALFVSGQNVSVSNSVFRQNAANDGGAIEDTAATLNLSFDSFDKNYIVAQNGGGGGHGGAVDIEQGATSVTVGNSLFLANASVDGGNGSGGAVFQAVGSLAVTNSQFSGNATDGGAGAVSFQSTGTIDVSGSSFNGNRAAASAGAVLVNTSGNATFTNDTFFANTTPFTGGAIFDEATSSVTLLNDTINGNTAATGGGVAAVGPTTLTIENTIIAGNTAATAPDIQTGTGITIADNGGNLVGNLTGVTGFGANTLTGNPQLGKLDDNGGQWAGAPSDRHIVETEALLVGSPAIGKGVAAAAPTHDERGFTRPGGGATSPSIGAYEPQYAANATPNQVFVENLYEILLNRTEDAGSAFWVNLLNKGFSAGLIAEAFQNSPEYLTNQVQMLFQRYLHRGADTGAVQSFDAFLAHGGSYEVLSAAIAGSEEYADLYGGNSEAFIDSLFEDALNRAPDANGLSNFNQGLANGASNGQVADAVFSSPEYLSDVVTNDFQSILGRQTDPQGLANLVKGLQNGLTDQTLLALIVGSAEDYGIRS
ncbi:MAG TPA: DUF4214 domain-containing protein [Pirellulales bacterium]|nr:DUF4214 domain-containing protein [Pirellulales bacterium]